MKALVWTAPGRMDLQEVPRPTLREGWALVKVINCGICGSDVSGFLGKNELRRPPLIMGHEFTGRVLEVGPGASRELVGRLVAVNPIISCGACSHCRRGERQLCAKRQLIGVDFPGGFAEFVAVPSSSCYVVNDEVSGALVEPLACAVRALRRAGPQLGDTAVVFGAGAIGLLVLLLLRAAGIRELAAVDLNEARLRWAQRLGASLSLNAREVDVARALRERFVEGVGIAVDAVGSSGTRLASALSVRRGGRVVLLGLHENSLNLDGNYVVRNEVEVLGSFAYSDGDFERATALVNQGLAGLQEGWIDIRPLEEGQEAFRRVAEGVEGYPKVLLSAHRP